MMVDPYTYEKNSIAKRKNPCINPRCPNFVEIQNSYNICMKCFDLLVEYFGSEHMIFDYSTKPALRCMTIKQLRNALRMAELEFPCVESIKRGDSNSQRRWHRKVEDEENEVTEKAKSHSSNRQKMR